MNMYAERTEKTSSENDKTGIPRKMKTGFENSSGFSFDDVRVHYNSEKPAQLRAHAYTQGNEVYVAPGQEKHLPHELGHVVQQKSDMVKPTGEIGGLPLNDDAVMENGADMIAEDAENAEELGGAPVQAKFKGDGVVQREHWLESSQGYNAMAGFGSAAVGMLGVAGGILGYLHSSKEKYVEQIEKYADEAEEACSEAEASYYEMLNTDDPNEKLKYAITTKKNAGKAKSKGKVAMKKYDVKWSMKHSDNANNAKQRVDEVLQKATLYEREADDFIPNQVQPQQPQPMPQPQAHLLQAIPDDDTDESSMELESLDDTDESGNGLDEQNE